MSKAPALELYLSKLRDGFTDEDVTLASGLSIRSWRELIKIGAMKTFGGTGRGNIRRCDDTVLNRASVCSAINRSGISLHVAGRIAYCIPGDHFAFEIHSPTFLFANKPDIADALFSSETPLSEINFPINMTVEILENRYVMFNVAANEEAEHDSCTPELMGEIKNNGTHFVSWLPLHAYARGRMVMTSSDMPEDVKQSLIEKSKEQAPKWDTGDNSDNVSLDFLNYDFEDHSFESDPERLEALKTFKNPEFKTVVSLTHALLMSNRRLLGASPRLNT